MREHGQHLRLIRRLQILSNGFSILCLLALALWLYRDYHGPDLTRSGNTIVVSADEVKNYFHDYDKTSSENTWEKPIYIPTGIFVRSIEFEGSNNVRVSGFAWQKYKNSLPAEIKHEIVFPEARSQDLKLAYRIQNKEEELVGWNFTASLRQEFDYLRFPFDRQEVWLRLWHADFARNIILVPDFSGYTSMVPAFKPGIEEHFVLEGWNVKQSFFSYEKKTYNSNFGFSNYFGQKDFPELYFNVGIQRIVLPHLVVYGLAPFGILFLIYFLFARFSRIPTRQRLFGLTWAHVVGTCSAFFFTALLAQSALRNTVKADGFVYLEGLYLLLYPLIVLVCIVATQLLTEPKLKLVQYRDDLIPKLLYWPIVMLSLIGITIFAFH